MPDAGAGLPGEMVRARRQVVDTGGRFGLCVLHPRIKQLMDVTKLSREFDIFDAEDEGVRNFEATAQA